MKLRKLARRVWRASWTLPFIIVPALFLTLWPTSALPLLDWVPLLLWPAVLVLSAVFAQSRLFFAALATALVWLPHHAGVTTPDEAIVLAHAALPLLLVVFELVAGRGVFSPPALLPWGLTVAVAAATVVLSATPNAPWLTAFITVLGKSGLPPVYPAFTLLDLSYIAAALILGALALIRGRYSDGLLLGFLVAAWVSTQELLPLRAAGGWSVAPILAAIAVLIEAYSLAYVDQLTGLPGRRALEQYSRQLGRRFTVAMIDIDHFKQFNDKYGHDAGDQVLRMVAKKLGEVRAGGKAFRYGGEEFTVVFRHARLKEIGPELGRIRGDIEESSFALRSERRAPGRLGKKWRGFGRAAQSVKVTISIGYSSRPQQNGDFYTIMKHADEALYQAKKSGRNRVEHS